MIICTCEALHVITIYKPPKMAIDQFKSTFKTILQKMLLNIPTIIIGDFNVNMFINHMNQ